MEEILNHPDELLAMLKAKMALIRAAKHIPPAPHWRFCYSTLNKVSTSFAFLIQQLPTDLRNAICVFYLLLRALDTVEDDTSIAAQVKVPILTGFHRHIYDRHWHFSCGTKDCRLLMDQFHHVSTAFIELQTGYQQVIEDFIKRVGAGMAKFICKEVESIDDYDEYCGIAAGSIGLGLSKLFHASGLEDLAPDHLSNSVGVFLQKINIIRDYLEDINEIPKPRMFWPREIWSKYVSKLEVHVSFAGSCNIQILCHSTDHGDRNLGFMLQQYSSLQGCSQNETRQDRLYYQMPPSVVVHDFSSSLFSFDLGLTARVIDRANTMADVYGATFDFSCMLKAKIDKNDPNATKTLSRIEEIQKICRDSGTLGKRKLYVLGSEPPRGLALVILIFTILALLVAWLYYD